MISSPGKDSLQRVAILGKPNVGKSTLFNALVGKRRAITHSSPRVTRDPVELECAFGSTRLLLVDTGGYTREGDRLDELVVERSLRSAREAALVLLVVDALHITPEDESFMETLRPLTDKLVLVVNKVDTSDRDSLAWNALSFGFSHVIGVSAAHHRNLGALKDMVALLLEDRPAKLSTRGGHRSAAEGVTIRIAILGKPNTGKSSLANRLLGEEHSIVSAIPGTTRDVVRGRFAYRGKDFLLLDTAGIRRRSRVQDSIEYYSVNRAIESVREADIVFLLIDATEGLSDQDKKIADLAMKEGKAILLVLNKWDLLKKKRDLLEEATGKVRFQFPVLTFAPLVPVSALTGFGVRGLLDSSLRLWVQLQQRVGTGQLNQALQSWMERHSLPSRGRSYKIHFATQVSANPVRFIMFVNRTAGFPASYRQYIENRIHSDMGFADVPVSLELRQSRKVQR